MAGENYIWVSTAITIVAFIANAAYIKGVFGTKIDNHEKAIAELDKNKVDITTCKATHLDVKHQIESVRYNRRKEDNEEKNDKTRN